MADSDLVDIAPRPPLNFAPDFASVLAQPRRPDCFELRVNAYRRCFVTHSGIGLKRFRIIPETTFDHLPDRFSRHFMRYAIYKFFSERRVRPQASNLLLLHNHWANGYFHWLTEVLVKLQFVDPAAYVIILPEDYPRFAAASLALFPCGGIVEVAAGHGLSASHLTIVENRPIGQFSARHVAWLRRSLIPSCGVPDTTPARIYITRRQEPLRRVENEDEVVEVLNEYGFQCIDSAQLEFCDQVRLFARCEALVSVHGAGLTNCVFMPERARVLELYRALTPTDPVMNSSYYHLCRVAGLDYYYQFCRHGRNHGPDADRVNIRVDLAKLRANVELMLSP